MSISISIDNDRLAAGIQSLLDDESAGVQTLISTDDGNEADVTLTNPVGGSLGGFQTAFNAFLNGTMFTSFTLSDAQKIFAGTNDGASSSADFVKVTASAGEAVSDLFFSNSAGNALDGDQVAGMQTLDGQSVYLWSNGDFCIATTSATAGAGRIVAAFYLKDDAADHLTAQVQMVTFEPLSHPNGSDPDDQLNFTNVLQVSAAGSQSFNFDALKSGGCLWCAVGSNAGAVVVSGYSLDVDGAGKIDGSSNKIAVSQGGTGTTIGLNNQLFDNVGETGVFTLVTGLDSLSSANGGIQSDYIVDHTGPAAEGLNYTGYINVTGAGIFVSQSQGNSAKSFDINLFTAGGGTTPEVGFNYIGTEPHGAFDDDTPVNVATVTVKDDDGNIVATWVAGADPDGAGPLRGSGATVSGHTSGNGTANIQVTITGNNIDVNGVLGEYTVSWTSAGGATFNRFTMVDEAGQFDVGRIDLTQGLASHQGVGGNLIVEDDGPTITASITGAPSPTVDESNLAANDSDSFAAQFSPVYGTDGPAAAPVTYALSTPGGDSGLVDTATGNAVFLFLESGKIVGREGTSALDAATGDIVFEASVDSAGVVTLDGKRAVVHLPNSGTDQSTTLSSAGLVVLTATAHDKDGDSASTPLNIGAQLVFKDDSPTITAQIQGGAINFVDDAFITHSLNGAVNADVITNVNNLSQAGVKEYTITSWDEPHTVYADLDGVLSADGTKVTYYSTSVAANQNSATAVYELALDQTGAGAYTFTVLQPPPISQETFDFTDLPSGQNFMGVIASDKADLAKGGLLVFPSNPDLNPDGTMTNISGTVNTSKGGGPVTIGNGNQAFDSPNEGAFFAYVDNPLPTSVGGLGLTQTTADDADTIKFNDTNEATRASVEIVQTSGAGTAKRPGPATHITAYDINPGNIDTDAESKAFALNPTAGGDEGKIISLKIFDANGNVVEYRTNLDAGASNGGALAGGSSDSLVGIQFVLDNPNGAGTADDDYSVIVSNLKANYTIEFGTQEAHDLARVQNVSGSYDIGGFNIFNNVNVPSQDFDFSVQISDYDNDVFGGAAATFANFAVHIDGISF